MPFDVYLREHLFAPLGMNDTGFYLPEEKASRLVAVQQPKDGRWARYPVTFYDRITRLRVPKRFSPASWALEDRSRLRTVPSRCISTPASSTAFES